VVTSLQKEQCLEMVKKLRPDLSHAKACKILNCSRTNKYYKKKMPEKDALIHQIISSVVGVTRIGRRKVTVKVQKKHPEIGSSRIRRVYTRNGFSLFKRMKNKRVDNPANPIAIPFVANEEWAMDFMSDSLTSGRKLRTLNIIDQYNRKCLKIEAYYSIPASRVIEILEKTFEKHGKPKAIRTDNGPEFTSGLFQSWMEKNDINWVKIQKGKPQQNAIIERFNKTYREDVLDANLLSSLEELQNITEKWIDEYNNERPHQALNYQTPNQYAA